MLSVICVYNDREVLETHLLASLRAQTAPHDLVLVDNRESRFAGAAGALNWGAARAEGRFLVFAHQDIVLLSTDWLARAEQLLGDLGEAGWTGVAGCTRTGRHVGILRDRAAVWGEVFDRPLEVQTLDECLLIRRREQTGGAYFDEGVPGWHAYGVEACCAALERGERNYVLPLPVWHDSKAINVAGIEQAYAYVWRKHGESLRRIYTMCGTMPEEYGWEGSRWKALPRRVGQRLAAARYELAGYERALRQGWLETLEELTADEEALEVLHARAPLAPVVAESIMPQPVRRRRVTHRFEGWEPSHLEADALVVATDLARSLAENLEGLRGLRARARRLWVCAELSDVPAESALWRELRRHATEVRLTRRYDKSAVALFELARW